MPRTLALFAGALLALTGCNGLTDAESVDTDGESIENAGPQVPATPTLSCAYPVGQYGVTVNSIVPVTHYWDNALPENGEPARRLDLAEMFDCDGAQGVDALVIDTSQYG